MKNIKNINLRKINGFSLAEVLVAVAVTSLIVGAAYAVFPTSFQSFKRGSNKIDAAQNARVGTDRIVREIREAKALASYVPPDQSYSPATEIKFQDGHSNNIQYIRYYLIPSELKREVSHYYLSGDPVTWVTYNTSGAIQVVDENNTVAQYITSLQFYGLNPINIIIQAQKEGEIVNLNTQSWARNL